MKVAGNGLRGGNAKTQAEVDALVNALNSHAAKFNEAQRKLRLVLQDG